MKSRNVRIFISSTFKDMNAERDYLTRWVFPQIQEYCAKRKITFTPVDLRWGIPEEDSRNGRVLRACIEEVDQARPFFIGILGLRYGWQPTIDELDACGYLSDEMQSWLIDKVADNASITEIEIEYAALKDMSLPHAAFYIRSEKMPLEPAMREPDNSEQKAHLIQLKSRIRKQHKYPVYDYASLEDFGKRVFADIMRMISEEYPDTEDDDKNAILAEHESTLERRGRMLCSMGNLTESIDKWIESGHKYLVVNSYAGYGASSSLALMVLYLRGRYSSAIRYFDFETVPATENPVEQYKRFFSLQKEQVPDDAWTMLGVDNGDLLDFDEIQEVLRFTDDNTSRNFHVAFAAETSGRIYDSVKFCLKSPDITVHGFTEAQQREFVQNFALQYGKRFSPAQVDKIVAAKNAKSPSELIILLKAIIEHGDYDTLDSRIDALVKESDSGWIFTMLVSREGRKVFEHLGLIEVYADVTTAISLVPSGIPEADMLAALSIEPARWAVIRPYLAPFLCGNEFRRRFRLASYKYCVLRTWDTPYRCQIGIKLMEWYLADESRYERGARIISEIYEDIWNLPVSSSDHSDDPMRLLLDRMLCNVMMSPDMFMRMSRGKWYRIYHHMARKGIDSVKTTRIYGRNVAQLSCDELIAYYRRMAQILSSFGHAKDAAWCYDGLASALESAGDLRAPLYRARPAMEIGQYKAAIKILDSSKLIGPTGILRHFSRQSRTQAELKAEIEALSIKVTALIPRWDISKIGSITRRAVSLMEQHKELEKDEIVLGDFAELVANLAYVEILFGDKNSCNEAIELLGRIEKIGYSIGLGARATCYFFLSLTMLHLRSEQYKKAYVTAYYATKSAEEAYGCSFSNIVISHAYSFQYAIARNLQGVAYYKTTGKYPESEFPYKVPHFEPFPMERKLLGVDINSVDADVRKFWIKERIVMLSIIKSIQPEVMLEQMNREIQQLTKELNTL